MTAPDTQPAPAQLVLLNLAEMDALFGEPVTQVLRAAAQAISEVWNITGPNLLALADLIEANTQPAPLSDWCSCDEGLVRDCPIHGEWPNPALTQPAPASGEGGGH